MNQLVLVLSFLVCSIAAQAQAQAQAVSIGVITATGSGCKENHLQTAVHGDVVSVVYPAFHLQSGNQLLSRIACTVAVPISVPKGFGLAVSAISTGISRLKKLDIATMNQELFFAGSTGQISELKLAAKHTLFSAKNDTISSVSCGSDLIVRLNLSALMRNSATAESRSKLTISKTQFFLKLIPCKVK